MYLYFNADGTLKEIINNDVFRIGNQNVNRLFIYWDKPEITITGMNYRFQFEDKTYSSTYTTYTTTNPTATTPAENCYIPTNDKRDLKFFNYGKAYRFYIINVDGLITGKNGAVTCTITLNYNVGGVATNLTLNLFAFNVENGVYSNDANDNINATQWNALVNQLHNEYTAGNGIDITNNAISVDPSEISYNDLANKPTIPTLTSQLTNDSGFIDATGLDLYATKVWVTSQGYTTFSGNYNDLTNKPTIPNKTSDLTNDSGFITNTYHDSTKQNDLTNLASYDKARYLHANNITGNLEWIATTSGLALYKHKLSFSGDTEEYQSGFNVIIDEIITDSATPITWATYYNNLVADYEEVTVNKIVITPKSSGYGNEMSYGYIEKIFFTSGTVVDFYINTGTTHETKTYTYNIENINFYDEVEEIGG